MINVGRERENQCSSVVLDAGRKADELMGSI